MNINESTIEKIKASLTKMIELKAAIETQRAELWEKQKVAVYPETGDIIKVRSELKDQLNKIVPAIMNIENLIQALENGGTSSNFTDKTGKEHFNIPDFRLIESDTIIFDDETILDSPRPIYIPKISEEALSVRGYVFDAIRVEKDSYILAIEKYTEKGDTDYVLVSLDQLVLIADYYFAKAKAMNRRNADEQTKRSEEYYDKLTVERRERHLNQRNFYFSLPAMVKKKITQEAWEAMTLDEKEKHYKPFKKYGPKKLTSKLEENEMWVSFHRMYQRFINPQAYPSDKDGRLITEPVFAGRMIGNKEVFAYWYHFREMLDFKIKDIRIQREELSDARKAAIETSFGNINTSDILKPKYGFLVKRQNGDAINPAEIEQIDLAYDSIKSVFGDLKPSLEKYNIKVSHTGKKNVFAAKAIGVWVPNMGTIGVSDKYGDNQFRSTFAHEIGHFIDFTAGQNTGKRYATDDYESTAGILAFTFRNKMNKPKSKQTDYVNSTKECFARAFQQYYGIEFIGEDAGISHSYTELDKVQPLFTADNFIGKDAYYAEVKPLIEKFLSENPELFLSDVSPEELLAAIEALEVLYEMSEDTDKDEIMNAIEGLKILLN